MNSRLRSGSATWTLSTIPHPPRISFLTYQRIALDLEWIAPEKSALLHLSSVLGLEATDQLALSARSNVGGTHEVVTDSIHRHVQFYGTVDRNGIVQPGDLALYLAQSRG